jgi:hypothetical protein
VLAVELVVAGVELEPPLEELVDELELPPPQPATASAATSASAASRCLTLVAVSCMVAFLVDVVVVWTGCGPTP